VWKIVLFFSQTNRREMMSYLNCFRKVTLRAVFITGLAITGILFFSLTGTARAQQDVGSIVGFITDPTGAVIPGAQVTVENEGTGEKRVVTTDAAGHYAVPNLPPAVYSMTATAKGFQKFVSNHNTLASNSTIQINGKLTVGEASQTVTVSSTAQRLQTQSPAIQAEVTGTQIQKEELNPRSHLHGATASRRDQHDQHGQSQLQFQ
jgi:hypothetical protein